MSKPSKSVVFVKKGKDGKKLAYECLKEMKAEEILAKKEKILIKPNITVARQAETGITTHPSIVEGTLQYLFDH